MIKTTTLLSSQSSPQTKKLKKVTSKAKEFGPSELTIQNILNYSKALQVMSPTQTEIVFGVLN
ncbi:MAG TPA: hypothetical protein VNY73_08195 [Bacteroidia bacterium]|jgi:hypothetical protein|nr:hypothetical protein [Bacteroidia bacterium]